MVGITAPSCRGRTWTHVRRGGARGQGNLFPTILAGEEPTQFDSLLSMGSS